MIAYLLLLVAVLSRVAVLGHPAWMNFAAEGGALLYFGARRPWREMLAPLAVFMATDYCLTVYAYHYPFRWQNYGITWIWYAAAMALGWILLSEKATVLRVGAGVLLGPTSFFVVSNYAAWIGMSTGPHARYTHTLAGLVTCYAAGIPFYRNDLLSTALLLAAAFGLPVLVRRTQAHAVEAAPVRK
jgi:hypothetical protein